MLKFSHRVVECLDVSTSVDSFNDLSKFLADLYELDKTASKGTHYDRLDVWLEAVNRGVRNNLEKYGFVNASKEQNDDAAFWWLIYQVVGGVCHSVHMKTSVANHHASAWERNQALIKDVEDIITFKNEETIHGKE